MAAVRGGDRLHDGQAEAAAVPVVAVMPAPVEPVERAGRRLAVHALARVGHLEQRALARLGEPDRDGRVRRGVLAHVAQQVREHLPDARLVGHHDQLRRRGG